METNEVSAKDLAAIARLSALASLPDNPHTHSFREAIIFIYYIIEKEGGDLEAITTQNGNAPKDVVSNVHTLPVGRNVMKAISRHLTNCWLRSVNKHTLKPGAGAPGMGHWFYALPTAPLTRVANGPSKWGLQHKLGLAAPGIGHLCGKQLSGAKEPCRAPLDPLGRNVACVQGAPGKYATIGLGIFW